MKKTVFNLSFFILLISTSCSNDFLDMNRNKKVIVPNSVEDYQAILDYLTIMNTGAGFILGEISTDDYYIHSEKWEQIPTVLDKNGYVWARDIFEGENSYDWNRSYARVLYANTVLEGLEKLKETHEKDILLNNVKGSSLFHRSYAFYHLSILFSDVYRKGTGNESLGIPLRETSDISKSIKRATVQEGYDKIIKDLKLSVILLPDETTLKIRPNKASAQALLARCFLQIEDYQNAFLYADSAFKFTSGLMDYNDINVDLSYPFPRYNKEVIFSDVNANSIAISSSYLNVDTTLYNSYDDLDLRKKGFFYNYAGNRAFKGSYDGSSLFFTGLTSSEMLFIRAESNLRLGNSEKALEDLNLLMKNRYQKGKFADIIILDRDQLLKKILVEKRKETIFRGIRWSDLRRLNKDPNTSTVLKRNIRGEIYELLPNDKRYIMPIPDIAVNIGALQQNER